MPRRPAADGGEAASQGAAEEAAVSQAPAVRRRNAGSE